MIESMGDIGRSKLDKKIDNVGEIESERERGGRKRKRGRDRERQTNRLRDRETGRVRERKGGRKSQTRQKMFTRRKKWNSRVIRDRWRNTEKKGLKKLARAQREVVGRLS